MNLEIVKFETESLDTIPVLIFGFQAQRPPDLPTKEAERKQKEEQKKIDNAVPLTEEEQNEKIQLLTQVILKCLIAKEK